MAMKPDDEQISELYRQSRSAAPPPHLDAAILQAARKATVRQPHAGSPFSGRWQVPASLVAVLVVAGLLVPLLEREPTDGIPVPAASVREESPSAMPQLLDRIVPEQAVSQDRLPRSVAPRVESKAVARSKKREAEPAGEMQRSLHKKAPASAAADRLSEDDVVPAAQWLETISALIEAGETARADEELQAFLVQHPDYSLPPQLRELQQRPRH